MGRQLCRLHSVGRLSSVSSESDGPLLGQIPLIRLKDIKLHIFLSILSTLNKTQSAQSLKHP